MVFCGSDGSGVSVWVGVLVSAGVVVVGVGVDSAVVVGGWILVLEFVFWGGIGSGTEGVGIPVF